MRAKAGIPSQRDAYTGDPPSASRDPLVRLEQEGRRNHEAEGLDSLEVDDQLEFHQLLHREIGGLGAFEDAIHGGGGARGDSVISRRLHDHLSNSNHMTLVHVKEASHRSLGYGSLRDPHTVAR